MFVDIVRILSCVSSCVFLFSSCEENKSEHAKKVLPENEGIKDQGLIVNSRLRFKKSHVEASGLFNKIYEHEIYVLSAWQDAEKRITQGEDEFIVEGDNYEVAFLKAEDSGVGGDDSNRVYDVVGTVLGRLEVEMGQGEIKTAVFYPSVIGFSNLRTQIILKGDIVLKESKN